METNSTNIRRSRYVSGGVTEVNTTGNIEWWERTPLTPTPNEQIYVVERKFVGRIDLIAALFLGEPRYWWVIAQYNAILDPHAEVVEGAVLYIPSLESVNSLLNGKTGGVPSTREVPLAILPIV